MKGGEKRNKQAHYKVFNFRLFDKVKYNGQEYFIFGRRNSGQFEVRTLIGSNMKVNVKNLEFLETKKSLLIESKLVDLCFD